MTTDERHYLMSRSGVKSLIAAFSKTLDTLEKGGHGLSHLSRLRRQAQDRDHWNKQFDAFYEQWENAFANAHAGEDSRSLAIRDSGLQCFSQIMNDLRNDMWTDKKIQSEPELSIFSTSFWALVHQKMKYAPIMIACDVSRERAIRMTKFAAARMEILTESPIPPATKREVFERIAARIDKEWATVEKIEDELTQFLEAKGSGDRLLSLDEYDFLNAERMNEDSTPVVLFDALPMGSAAALDVVVPDVNDVLFTHCLPELKKQDRVLYAALKNWLKKMEKNNEVDAPENNTRIDPALQQLRDCVESIFRSRLK